jgi:hypothetical protein
MAHQILPFVLLVVGLIFTILGARIVFSATFLEHLRSTLWKKRAPFFSEKQSYAYDKYGRGLTFLLVGLGFSVFAVLMIVSLYH